MINVRRPLESADDMNIKGYKFSLSAYWSYEEMTPKSRWPFTLFAMFAPTV